MIKYKFYTFYIRINCDQIEVYFALCFQNILNITNFGDILFFPSNFLCSSRISFTFPSKFISFKFPSLCKNFLSKGNFLQSGSAGFQYSRNCSAVDFKCHALWRVTQTITNQCHKYGSVFRWSNRNLTVIYQRFSQ